MTHLFQIIAPDFVAGIIVADGFVIRAAPILAWAHDRTIESFSDYCKEKHWQIIEVGPRQID
jgi:hypothetical protein